MSGTKSPVNANRLNILFITPWYPIHENPMAGVFIKEHARAVQIYDNVIVIHLLGASREIKSLWQIERDIENNTCCPITVFRIRWKLIPFPYLTYLLYLFCIFMTVRRIRTGGFQPNIVHAHIYSSGIPAVMLSKFHNIPAIITEHSSAFMRGLLPPKEIRKIRYSFRNAHLILPVSSALKETIEAIGIRGNFRIVPNAVDTNRFKPPHKSKHITQIKSILFVGSLLPVKCLHILIKAIFQVKSLRRDWRLDIIGEGPQRAELENLVSKLDLRDYVTFHGQKRQDEVAQLMRDADFLVLTSEYETFSVAIAEALVSGLPVISTRCGGPEELINNENGVLISRNDPIGLAHSIVWMLDNLDIYSAATISQSSAKQFGMDKVGEVLHSIYLDTLASWHKN